MQEIEERNNEFSGVNIAKYPIRKYLTENIGSHILGYIGAISSDEYKVKKELGYSQHAMIGKSGVESTFEEFLKGENHGCIKRKRTQNTGVYEIRDKTKRISSHCSRNLLCPGNKVNINGA
jgi:cell division protein FtsI/penicillin-binding protein 2